MLAGCAGKKPPERTERERDSLIAQSRLPGAAGVKAALKVSDSAAARHFAKYDPQGAEFPAPRSGGITPRGGGFTDLAPAAQTTLSPVEPSSHVLDTVPDTFHEGGARRGSRNGAETGVVGHLDHQEGVRLEQSPGG